MKSVIVSEAAEHNTGARIDACGEILMSSVMNLTQEKGILSGGEKTTSA